MAAEDRQNILEEIKSQWEHILGSFEMACSLQPGQMVVIGCSTSEILGQKIGKAGSMDVAEILLEPFLKWAEKLGVFPAFQCCEHLNRVLVIEEKCAEKYNLEPVLAIPALSAGGAMSSTAWQKLSSPVAVEQVRAHAGIDIGDTFIGMHLRSVVVPIRIDVNKLGNAHLTLAKTRPRYVGGPRAVYNTCG